MIPEEVEKPKGPTQDQLPHVSQEAAAIDKIMHGKKCDGNAPGSPEIEQGTPVEEVGYIHVHVRVCVMLMKRKYICLLIDIASLDTGQRRGSS